MKKKFLVMNKHLLRQLEAGQFIRRVLTDLRAAWKAMLSNDPLLNIHINRLENALTDYDAGMVKAILNDLSEKILKFDDKRDKVSSTFRKACRLALDSEEEEEVEAAKSLMNLWKAYKGLEKMTFEAESFAIHNLLQDFATPKYMAHLVLLGLENYPIRLKEENDAFDKLFAERSQEVAVKEVFDSKVLRKALFESYDGMKAYVEVMLDTLPTPMLEEAFAIIENARKYYNDTLATRQGRKEAAKAAEVIAD